MGVRQESLGVDRLTEYEAAEMSKNFRVRQIEEIKQIRQEGHNETVRYANTEALAKGLDKDTYTKQEASALIMQTLMF